MLTLRDIKKSRLLVGLRQLVVLSQSVGLSLLSQLVSFHKDVL